MLPDFIANSMAWIGSLTDWSNLPYLQRPILGSFIAALAIPLAVLRYRRQNMIGHSNVGLHTNLASSKIGKLPACLFAVLIMLLGLAIAKPVRDFTVETVTKMAHEIVLGVDFSGSMDGIDVPGAAGALMPQGLTGCQNMEHPDDNKPDPARTSMRRINAACFAVTNFVTHRDGDRIGIMMFNDQAYWLVPLWWELDVVVSQAQRINRRGTSGGTNFQGPTGPLQIGYNHLIAYGQGNTGRVMIMVTDGEDSITEENRALFTELYKKANIHLYVLGIGSGWGQGKDPDLNKLVTAVGGKVFSITDANSLLGAFQAIDEVEKSKINREITTNQQQLYPYVLFLALIIALMYLRLTRATGEQA